MGGTSSTTQSSTQQSQLQPYGPAQSGLNGILGSLYPSTQNLGVTPGITNAFNTIEQNATQNGNPYAAPAANAALTQLGGGPNFTAASGLVNGGYNAAAAALSPYLSGNAFDPTRNPALASELGAVAQQVQNTVAPMFAAAGRMGSPAMAQAMAAGITQNDAPILQNAASNQIGAAGSLGGLANSAGGILGNLDAGNSAIQSAGINNAAAAYNMANLGPQAYLAAALQQSQLPIQNAATLGGILSPIAAQFGMQTGSGSSEGTTTMSPAQQFATIAGGIGSLLSPFRTSFPKIFS